MTPVLFQMQSTQNPGVSSCGSDRNSIDLWLQNRTLDYLPTNTAPGAVIRQAWIER